MVGIVCCPSVSRTGRIAVTPVAVAFVVEVTEIAHSPAPFSGVISAPLRAQAESIEAKVRVAPDFETAESVAFWR